MYRDVRDEVAYWTEQIRLRDGLRAQRAWLEKHRAQLHTQLVEAGQAIDAERGDLEALRESSFERLVDRLRGRLQEKMEQQREELAAAEIRYTELAQQVTALDDELRSIDRQIAELGPLEHKHTEAFRRKAAEILARDDEVAATVSAMVDRIEAAQAFDFQLGEAAQAGANVMAALHQTLRILGSRSLSLDPYSLEVLFDVGYLGLASWLERMTAAVSALKVAVLRFQSELNDVRQQLHVQVELDDFVRAARGALYSAFPDQSLKGIAAQGRRHLFTLREQVLHAIEGVYQQHAANHQRLEAEWAAYQSAVSMA